MRTGFIKEKKCKRCGKIELARFIKDELCDDCYYNVDRFSENREKIKWKDKWQKLKEFLNEDKLFYLFKEEFVDGYKNCLLSIKNKMRELEAEDVED